MKTRSLNYIVLMMILLVGKPSFAMHQLVLRGAKLIGKGMLPILGGALSYNKLKNYNQFCSDIDEAGNNPKLVANVINNTRVAQVFDEPIPQSMEDLLRNRWKKIGNPSLQKLPIVVAEPGTLSEGMIALSDKCIVISYDQFHSLDNAMLRNTIDNPTEIITEKKILSLHEVGHIINHDIKNSYYALGIIPIAVETVSSGATHLFNKAYRVGVPKTWLKTVMRSSAAIGSIIPKLYFNCVGLLCYKKYCEVRADRFACENAETRYELELFRDYFRKHQYSFEKKHEGIDGVFKNRLLRHEHAKFDPLHPYPGDRADMVQKYLDKIDKKA